MSKLQWALPATPQTRSLPALISREDLTFLSLNRWRQQSVALSRNLWREGSSANDFGCDRYPRSRASRIDPNLTWEAAKIPCFSLYSLYLFEPHNQYRFLKTHH